MPLPVGLAGLWHTKQNRPHIEVNKMLQTKHEPDKDHAHPGAAEAINISVSGVAMPQIPRVLIKNEKISQVLYATAEEFYFEERAVIYLYCLVGFNIEEIAKLTKLPTFYIISTLVLYSQRLVSKLDIFQMAIPYNPTDMAPVCEMLEVVGLKEVEQQAQVV